MVLWLIEWGIFNFRSTLPPHPASPSSPTPPPSPLSHTRARACHSCVQHQRTTCPSPPSCTPPFTPTRPTPPPYLPFSNKASYYTELPLLPRGTMFAFCGTLRRPASRHFIIPPRINSVSPSSSSSPFVFRSFSLRTAVCFSLIFHPLRSHGRSLVCWSEKR